MNRDEVYTSRQPPDILSCSGSSSIHNHDEHHIPSLKALCKAERARTKTRLGAFYLD